MSEVSAAGSVHHSHWHLLLLGENRIVGLQTILLEVFLTFSRADLDVELRSVDGSVERAYQRVSEGYDEWGRHFVDVTFGS
jgi:hypothetical protein